MIINSTFKTISPLFPDVRNEFIAPCALRICSERLGRTAMHVIQTLCSSNHRIYHILIWSIRNIHEAAIIVLSIKSSGNILIRPLEVSGADKCRMSISIFSIISVAVCPVFLRICLPKRLCQSPVDSSEMILTYNHRLPGTSIGPVEHILIRSEHIGIETEDIEMFSADRQQSLGDSIRICESHSQIKVVRVILLVHFIHRLQEFVESVINKCHSVFIGIGI